MFSSCVQPPLVSLFSSTGSDNLALFSTQTDPDLPADSFVCLLQDLSSSPLPPSPAKLVLPVCLENDSANEKGEGYTLTQTVLHIQSPTLRTTFIRCPPTGNLGLKHPWVHVQVRNMGKGWSLELGVVDISGVEGVIRCSTFQVPLSFLSFCVTSPLLTIIRALSLTVEDLSILRVFLRVIFMLMHSQKEPSLKYTQPPVLHLPLAFPHASTRPLTTWSTISLNVASLLLSFSSTMLFHVDDTSDGEGGAFGRPTKKPRPAVPVPSGMYSHVSYVKIYATCRLRRMWFSQNGTTHDLPWEFQLHSANY